jgi:hypothetical protein
MPSICDYSAAGSRFARRVTLLACCGFSLAIGSEKENDREKLPAVSRGSAATASSPQSYFSPASQPFNSEAIPFY